jgi:GT2 family glycosyltransferase
MTITHPSTVAPRAAVRERPRATGKFLYAGGEKLRVRGVTYGTFRPDADGAEFPARDVVERDLAAMAEAGINAVRTYTVPPRWLLDAAQRHGLRVMVGLGVERWVGHLNERGGSAKAVAAVRAGVRACAGHVAVLCYVLGNEIPGPTVRWLGARRVEALLRRLYDVAKREDPGGLVTYANYPTTEYLQLGFLDLVCFNVYLEQPDRLRAYLARLHNRAGDRPLLLAEIGLDSVRNGEDAQAHALDWQVRLAFATGCAGTFVYAWTDEWHRGGEDVFDWAFGLTDRDRQPKPAFWAVREAYEEVPFPPGIDWPRVSVVVCSYNGARTLGDCLGALARVEYPDVEVIVVDDGSTDATARIASDHGVRLVRTPNRGLSSARNTGLAAATGEIVAYLDDDAYPDPDWLTFLAAAFMASDHAAIGGPNVAPPGDGLVAECVDNAPGNPIHVLLSDDVAEHVPGCNMAVRRDRLAAIGGFDAKFRVAGDDVDCCWRIQDAGWTIGYAPGAMVLHHRRRTVRTFWRQQRGYGRAEAMLERKWPEKYNAVGHVTWHGRLYGKGIARPLSLRRGRIYQGTWGSAPFQSLYEPSPGTIDALLLMPEWYLLVLVTVATAAVGVFWHPLLRLLPVAALAVAGSLGGAIAGAVRARFTDGPHAGRAGLARRVLTAALHLLQPAARLWGRLSYGLAPWRLQGRLRHVRTPVPHRFATWVRHGVPPDERLRRMEQRLRSEGASLVRGGDYDAWDLELRAGLLGAARLLLATEEQGGGSQLVRLRVWPRLSVVGPLLAAGLLVLGALAARAGEWDAVLVLGGAVALLVVAQLREAALAVGALTALWSDDDGGAA